MTENEKSQADLGRKLVGEMLEIRQKKSLSLLISFALETIVVWSIFERLPGTQ